VDQVRNASLIDTVTSASVNQYAYDYDPAGNRTDTQVGSAITTSTRNNLNQLTSQTSGGKMHFRGTVNEPATVTVGGNSATVDAAGSFDGTINVNVGNGLTRHTATERLASGRHEPWRVLQLATRHGSRSPNLVRSLLLFVACRSHVFDYFCGACGKLPGSVKTEIFRNVS